ncbi:probable plastid-lipid-associated protein 8, chloroplastic [Papaver somniferum]|uniref:probable plastid-lipid-associated protein 8, chloroplastic n=1 Tax=Papaver somniferum TaxID=3469 RepID=UPI000E6F95CA|nr:probable plastid-lipid-associated protein 8, chloroplastic [Papaver somniferum]
MASSSGLFSSIRGPEISKSKTLIFNSKPYHHHHAFINVSFPLHSQSYQKKQNKLRVSAASSSISMTEDIRTGPEDLVASILSKVTGTDRGVSLTKEGHKEVAEVAQKLQKYCVDEPVKCPLIFGEWDVLYCSVPTSPGGGYRSALGRVFFKTKQMIQVVEAPACVKNKVSFSLFGFIDGEVSLKGALNVLDEKWIQVIFEPPELKVGGFNFTYGGESEVKLEISYVDEKIRLGKGSRGSLFVFLRR